jgi:hypothetical protein
VQSQPALRARRQLAVVGDEQHRQAALAPGAEDDVHHAVGVRRVQLARDLVGQ